LPLSRRRSLRRWCYGLKILLCFAPLLFLWQALVRQVSIEWTLNPQYTFGWVMPFLCGYLLYRKVSELRLDSLDAFRISRRAKLTRVGVVLALAACYAPIRLIQEANPDWRLVSWALAFETVSLTALVLSMVFQFRTPSDERSPGFLYFAFPCLFFLVAVPWPTLLEHPLIGGLTTIVASGANELLGVLSIPSVLHGNLIEVGTGTVGIDGACSGIRSFQASLMLALLFGELCRLSLRRRFLLITAGLVLSVELNLFRATLLAVITAKKGPNAMAGWHDAAGPTVPAICFLGIWLLASFWRKPARDLAHDSDSNILASPPLFNSFTSLSFPLALTLWFGAIEAGTEIWYRLREHQLPLPVTWHIELPRTRTGFRELPFAPVSRQLLRFDEGLNASWWTAGGLRCQAIFLQWNPGRIAPSLARNHTPADCLLAAGGKLVDEMALRSVFVHGLELPFRGYIAWDELGPIYVFYCLWEDRARVRAFEPEWLTYGKRLNAVLAGQRNSGQRSIELAFWGAEDESVAQSALESALNEIVVVPD
jgi:exosortase